jgi:hypothetical protein
MPYCGGQHKLPLVIGRPLRIGPILSAQSVLILHRRLNHRDLGGEVFFKLSKSSLPKVPMIFSSPFNSRDLAASSVLLFLRPR